jgi:DNA helicase-2/ATP-dependent DNA helicase PcrA
VNREPPASFDGLTSAQREAIEHIDGPMLVLAGPGSGKTRVVTHRIANLLRHGVRASNLLALTFTNKAADEMRRRVEALAPGERVWVSTFHRFCARLLRKYAPLVGLAENYTIYDMADSKSVLSRTLDAVCKNLLHFTPQQVAAAISRAKNQLITPEVYRAKPGNALGDIVQRVYPFYQAQLLKSAAVDFDDLLLHVATLLRENAEIRAALDEQFRYILVDEYQDTNLAQYTIIRGLSIDYPNLSVTGDPDQSIYGWRGAQLSNILDFEQDYPDVRVVRLERNYRSTKRILQAADYLIAHNLKRKSKSLFTENEEGRPVSLTFYPDQRSEADTIAQRIANEIDQGRRRPRDFAIFYRTNALSRTLEFALRAQGLPYQMVHGVEFFQRKEVKDLLAYLQILNNPRDDVALQRIINTPARDIGKSTVKKLLDYATVRGFTLLEAARHAGLIEGLSKRAALAVAKFVALIDRLGTVSAAPVEEVLGHVLTASRYREQYEFSELEEDLERLANIDELKTAARQFDERDTAHSRLEGFLEQASLVNDTDGWTENLDRVTMMTLHAAKGLEFPVVFIVAIEEGLLPHERSQDSVDQLEEERRLLFVGITRAEAELHLSMARYREFRGQRRMTVPSPFLGQLPRSAMEVSTPGYSPQAYPPADPHDQEHLHEEFEEPAMQIEDGPSDTRPSGSEPIASAKDPKPHLPSLRGLGGMKLTTAAEMAGLEGDGPRPSVESFAQGMLVRHPEYGLGTIVALSGEGSKRSATVEFLAAAGFKKFMLEMSPLRPVGKSPG